MTAGVPTSYHNYFRVISVPPFSFTRPYRELDVISDFAVNIVSKD